MDIEIKITPRLIERAVFIIIIIGLIISNVYFYKKAGSQESIVEEGSFINESKTTTTTTTIKKAEAATTTTTIEETAADETNYKYTKAKSDKPDGTCTAGWRCYKPYYKGFVLASCNWVNVQNCVNGCEEGKCKE